MKAEFLGHSAWLIESDGHRILIDPFLKGNPVAVKGPDDVHPDFILLSHAHGDHLGDTVEIAKRTNAQVISTFEVANHVAEQGVEQTHGMHIGGTFHFPFGRVRITPAFHGAGVAGGHAAGFILRLPTGTVYHTGDTSLFSDMKLLGELEEIDLLLLPIGGNYTMDQDDAVRAAQMVGAKHVIPMHYNTFPLIEADPVRFQKEVEESCPSKVTILKPGETFELP